MKRLLTTLIVIGMLIGAGDCFGFTYNTIRSRAVEYANVTKNQTIKYSGITMDWTVKYASIAKNRTVKYAGLAKNNIVKYTIITKDGVIEIVNSRELRDMLYLAAHGAAFGFVGNSEHIEGLIKEYPITGRMVLISSRVIAVVIVSKVAIKITYYIIRSFANGGVYTSSVDGVVNYVGQTNNFARRAVEWAKEGRVITPIFRSPFLCERRIVEETLINRYGIINLVNKIHSIRP